jgi:hypothetical protein
MHNGEKISDNINNQDIQDTLGKNTNPVCFV